MINKVILIGNLGADPETRFTQSGVQVTTFSVATTERWKDPDGQPREQTEWHRIVAWRKLAEICGQYLHKGSKVYIEGKLQTRKWQDQNGADRYTTEIVANEMKMLDSRSAGSEGGYGGDYGGGYGGGQRRGGNDYGNEGGGSRGGYGVQGGQSQQSGFTAQEPSGPTYGGGGSGEDVPF